jgi:hypothetical protein
MNSVDREVVGGLDIVVLPGGYDLGDSAVCSLEFVAGMQVDGVDKGGLGDVVKGW